MQQMIAQMNTVVKNIANRNNKLYVKLDVMNNVWRPSNVQMNAQKLNEKFRWKNQAKELTQLFFHRFLFLPLYLNNFRNSPLTINGDRKK